MKRLMTRVVTAACAAIFCISTAITPAYASAPEMEKAPEVPETFLYAESGETTTPADDLPDDEFAQEAETPVIPEEAHDEEGPDLPEIMTGASNTEWDVGDNVKAQISSKNLYFTSENGQLYDNWKEIIGDAVLSVESVSVSNGKLFLPEDSSFLFEDMTRLKSINLSGADTSHVNEMVGMFADLPALTQVKLSGFDTSGVTDMFQMFYGCSALTELDLTGFDTSGVTDMSQMFYGCSALTKLNLDGFSTSGVTDMDEMFYGCESLSRLDLSSFNTSNVKYMSSMFSGCGNLTELDLRNFDTTKASTDDMFLGCSKLAKLVTPKKNSNAVKLPRTMYDKSGKSYTSLPGLTSSITLTSNKPAVTPTSTPTPKPTSTPKPTPTPAKYAFSDVQNPKHAYFNAIYWAADKGITKGYPDGTFGINRSCTRGEMMMFLWRYAGKPAAKAVSKSPFKDVPKTHTFYKAILWGSQKGITKGYSDGTFGVNRNVSRGECMMFLWRLNGKPAPKAVSKSPFSDVPKTHVFYKAILWGAQKKITTGYTSGAKKGTFGIDENCTRGQIVTFLYRAK